MKKMDLKDINREIIVTRSMKVGVCSYFKEYRKTPSPFGDSDNYSYEYLKEYVANLPNLTPTAAATFGEWLSATDNLIDECPDFMAVVLLSKLNQAQNLEEAKKGGENA